MTQDPTTACNPYDGSAAVLVPQNIEKLPLYHWRPGSRVLSVGSRDGSRFDGVLPDDELRTYRRAIDPDLISRAGEQLSLTTWAATWTCSLAYPQGLGSLLSSALGEGIIQTAGFGDPALAASLLGSPQVAAWSLLVDVDFGLSELAQTIIAGAPHLEMLIGLSPAVDDRRKLACLKQICWERVSAVHLQPIRPTAAVGEQLHRWEDRMRAALPADLLIYDSRRQTTLCPHCQVELVWRSSGRSRLAAIQADSSQCMQCGQTSPLRW